MSLPRLLALTNHPRKALADAALRATEALDPSMSQPASTTDAAFHATIEENSRTAALSFIRVIQEQVQPLLRELPHDPTGSVVFALRPREDDYAKVFVPAALDVARAAYESMWSEPLRLDVPAANTRLESWVAPAGMLAYDNELSTHFPGGYRHIAHLLDPRRAWVRWRYTRPGETSGMSFDGLVWCDDHWAWFPKPFRVLASVAAS